MKAPTTKALMLSSVWATLIQVGATIGLRFALVAAVPILSPFLPPEEIARFDMFLVVSSFVAIILALGTDSGLSSVSTLKDDAQQIDTLWCAIAITLTSFLLVGLPSTYLVTRFFHQDVLSDFDLWTLVFYAASSTVMVSTFSFFRWRGDATRASLLIVIGHGVALFSATFLFWTSGSLSSFFAGLLFGSIIGATLCVTYITFFFGGPIRFLRSVMLDVSRIRQLLFISLPFLSNSIFLLARRFIDRFVFLSFASVADLGSYATITRSAELIAFLFGLPAIGFSPTILRHYREATGRRLAFLLFNGYMIASVFCTAGTFFVWWHWGRNLFPDSAAHLAALFIPAVVANLLFGQMNVSGYGYVIAKNSTPIYAISLLYVLVYGLVAVPFAAHGHLVLGVGLAGVISSLVYTTIFIGYSEKLHAFGYNLLIVHIVNAVLVVASCMFLLRSLGWV